MFLAPLIYGIIALNTGDLLWASPVFAANHEAIVIHSFGQDMRLGPVSQEFAEVNSWQGATPKPTPYLICGRIFLLQDLFM